MSLRPWTSSRMIGSRKRVLIRYIVQDILQVREASRLLAGRSRRAVVRFASLRVSSRRVRRKLKNVASHQRNVGVEGAPLRCAAA